MENALNVEEPGRLMDISDVAARALEFRARLAAAKAAVPSTPRHCELLEGWHAREGNGWRWAESQFTVRVARRHEFDLHVYVPELLLARFGAITLSASVDGVPLGRETFDAAGEHIFHRRIPQDVSEQATIEFRVSDAVPGDDRDPRERAIIVSGLAVR